jgi:imidazolonepropionase
LIQDGAVLIVDGRIEEVGLSRRIENLKLARQAREIDASGRVVMPGFVDSDTHLVGGPARMLDYEMRLAGASPDEVARAGGGLLALARAIQELSPRTLAILATRSLEEALRHGTTTIAAKSGFGLTEPNEMKILRVHAALGRYPVSPVSTLLASGIALDFQSRPDAYVDWLCSHVLPAVKRRKLAEFADIRCETGAFTAAHACRYFNAARQLGFGLKMDTGTHPSPGAIETALQAGVASIGGLIGITEQEIALLAVSATIATLLPGPVFHRGSGCYAPARQLIDSGAAVSLASNYNLETSPSQNMQMMIALACRMMNMTPAEAISAATINAAHTLRRASSTGSLEIGKSADLLILGVPDYREIPYHFGINVVDLVMKSGTVLVERSEVKWPVR